jgi:hypothetical protein
MKEDAATHPALAEIGVSVSGDVIEEVAALAKVAEAVARCGGSVPNHGRRR